MVEIQLDTLTSVYRSEMGYTVKLQETERGGFDIFSGGRVVKSYMTLPSALRRYKKEVASVKGWEAQLVAAGKWHPVRLCAGGCGLEMRDGREDQSEPRGPIRCVGCGPFPKDRS